MEHPVINISNLHIYMPGSDPDILKLLKEINMKQSELKPILTGISDAVTALASQGTDIATGVNAANTELGKVSKEVEALTTAVSSDPDVSTEIADLANKVKDALAGVSLGAVKTSVDNLNTGLKAVDDLIPDLPPDELGTGAATTSVAGADHSANVTAQNPK